MTEPAWVRHLPPVQRPNVPAADATGWELPKVTLGYQCRRCGRTSHNPTDVRERYCGECHVQFTGDVIVTSREDPWLPGTHPIIRFPDWGCSIHAHGAFGWCASCPHVNGRAELVAWRLHAGKNPTPGYAGAVKFTQGQA